MIEADRVLVYLGFFLAAFLIAQTDERRQRFAEGLAIAVTLVALLGLGSRLLPHVLERRRRARERRRACATRSATGTPTGRSAGSRSRCCSGRAAARAGRRCAGSRSRRCRRSCSPSTSPTRAAACSPSSIAAGCLIALSRDRLWLLATLAIGALGALPAVLAVQARDSLTDNLASQAAVDQGVTVLLILLGGIAVCAGCSSPCCGGWRARGPADRTGDRALAPPGPAQRRRARPRGDRRSALAIAVGGRAWNQFSSSDVQFPNAAPQHFCHALRRRAPRLLAGRDRRLRRRAAPRHRRRHLRLLLGPAPLDRPAGARRPLPLPARPSPSWGWSAACSCWRWSGSCSGRASPPGARRRAEQRDRYAALLAAMLAFAVGAGDRLVLGDRRGSARSSSSPPGVLVAPAAPSSPPAPRADRTAERPASGLPSAASRRLDLGARPDRPAARRPRDHGQPAAPRPTADLTSAVGHAEHRPLDRALGGLALRAAGPARRAAGRLRRRAAERLSQAIDREDRNWQLYYLRSRVEHEAGDAAARERRPRAGAPAEPAGTELPARQAKARTLSETAQQAPSHAPPSAGEREDRGRRAARARARAARGSAARCCAACSRPATGLALIAALCVVTAATSTTDVATLFWAVLFSPVWILVVKLHGLYDNDHRRIRHSTLDELPSLISASALGTLAPRRAAGAEPGGAARRRAARSWSASARCSAASSLRAVLRFLWQRLTGVATGHRDRPAGGGRHGRPPRLHPPRGAPAAWSATSARRSRARRPSRRRCRGWARSPTSPRVAREHRIERVVVTEQEMSETAAERLIEECKAAGLGLTFLPQHYGLLGPGDRAEPARRAAGARLPLLRPAALDPGDEAGDGRRRLRRPAGPALPPAGRRSRSLILLDSGRPVFFRQRRAGKDGRPFTMLKFRTMVTDAEERLGELVDLETLEEPAFKIQDDPRVTRAGRFLRRTSLDELPQLVNVLEGRHVAGRAAARGGGGRRPLRRAPARCASRSSPA